MLCDSACTTNGIDASEKHREYSKCKTSSLGQEDESKEKDNSKFTLVHAGTPKFRHQRRLIYETSDEYVMALSEICNSVKKYSELQLIIKTRPFDYELTEKTLLELLSPLLIMLLLRPNFLFMKF